MEQNRFFKFLWRANAVLLFLAGIGLVIILFMVGALLINENRDPTPPPPPLSAAEDKSPEKQEFRLTRQLRNYSQAKPHDFAYFELRSGEDSYGKLSSGSSSQLRNIGVFNLNANSTHWIFPDAQQEIENHKSVARTLIMENGDTERITTGFLLTVAKSLPDGTISRDLLAMTPDGKTLKTLLPGVSNAPYIETSGDGKKRLIIETKTHIDVYPFDVDMLTVGKPTRVSIP